MRARLDGLMFCLLSLIQVMPGLHHALDSRAARLSRFEICMAEELRLAGREALGPLQGSWVILQW